MSALPVDPPRALPPLRVTYAHAALDDVLADRGVLAAIDFGHGDAATRDPRHVRVALQPLGDAPVEVWHARGEVHTGREGEVRWSRDDDYLFFAVEIDEHEAGGPDAAAERAYRAIGHLLATVRFADGSPAHVLRLWNYLDAINDGDGDDERYRHFCAGRARGIALPEGRGFPAATAIGAIDGRRVLQVYGLAARADGERIENPRQVSAWRYPREYGPTPPTFARAMRTPAAQLLISGTAAVVGHASQHAGDTAAQVEETLDNLGVLFAAIPAGSTPTLLKAYVRDAADADAVRAAIRARLPGLEGLVILHGDICRRELRVEVDGIRGG